MVVSRRGKNWQHLGFFHSCLQRETSMDIIPILLICEPYFNQFVRFKWFPSFVNSVFTPSITSNVFCACECRPLQNC